MHRKAGQKISLIATNQILLEVCTFARNVLIARFMGAETLGQFIFLILSIRLFAMSTDLAVERYVLQADNAHLKKALSTVHFVSRFRGVALGILLLFMGLYQIQGIDFAAYAALAISAFIRGFTHKGYVLKQRSLNFRPALYVEGLTAVVGLVGIYVIVTMAPSLEAICACMIVQSFLHTGLSHTLSDERYTSSLDICKLKEMLQFGWPLLLTGITMFWSMQGERLLLSATLSASDFAHFSMLFQLALVPVLVLSRMALSYCLPLFASLKQQPHMFHSKLDQFHRWIYGLGIIYALTFALFANVALESLFGHDFKAEGSLIVLAAVAQLIRLYRAPQSIAAQALGQTDIPFKANLVRVFFVLFSVISLAHGATLETVLMIACFGEGCAWATQGLFFSFRNRVDISSATPQLKTQEIV